MQLGGILSMVMMAFCSPSQKVQPAWHADSMLMMTSIS